MPTFRPRFRRAAAHGFWGHASGAGSRGLAGLLLIALTGVLILLTHQLWRQQERVHELQEALDRRQARQAVRQTPLLPQVSAEAAKAHNTAVRQLNIPWSRLWDALERHVNAEVAVLSMEPDATHRQVRIVAEAKDAETLLRFAQALGEDRSFAGMRLRQEETNELDANRPVRLTFELRWRDIAIVSAIATESGP